VFYVCSAESDCWSACVLCANQKGTVGHHVFLQRSESLGRRVCSVLCRVKLLIVLRVVCIEF